MMTSTNSTTATTKIIKPETRPLIKIKALGNSHLKYKTSTGGKRREWWWMTKMRKEETGSQSASPQRPTNTTVGHRTGTYCSFWSPIGPGRNETTADAPFPTLRSTAPHSRCHGDPVTSLAVVTSTSVQVYQIPTWFVVPDVWVRLTLTSKSDGRYWSSTICFQGNQLWVAVGTKRQSVSVIFFNLTKHQNKC